MTELWHHQANGRTPSAAVHVCMEPLQSDCITGYYEHQPRYRVQRSRIADCLELGLQQGTSHYQDMIYTGRKVRGRDYPE